MTSLMICDLPLSEQIALELAWAEKLAVLFRDVFQVLDSPVKDAVTPWTASTSPDAGESDSIPFAEHYA
jgi:hypothetical protein